MASIPNRAELTPATHPAWPFPFADRFAGRLTGRQWMGLVAVFTTLHLLALLLSRFTGNFDPQPNHDHVHTMRQILEQGYPTLAVWPPGFGYYLAAKWKLTQALGLPYWTSKLLVDPVPLVLSGTLAVLLGSALSRNRVMAAVAGVGLLGAPLFILGSAEELAVVLFQPLFLAGFLLLVQQLQRPRGPGLVGSGAAGACIGLACLVRGNPQLLILALAPLVLCVARRSRSPGATGRAVAALAVFATVQGLVLLPWSLMQRKVGEDGLFTAPVVYYAFFDGMTRHPGFRVSDAVRSENRDPDLSLGGVVRFHQRWLRRDPWGLLQLYAVKFVRSWYLSDSGRWDRAILLTHAPYWILALLGSALWWRRAPADPALLLTLTVVVYMWTVSALVSGLARYSAPVYGFLAILAGAAVMEGRRRWQG